MKLRKMKAHVNSKPVRPFKGLPLKEDVQIVHQAKRLLLTKRVVKTNQQHRVVLLMTTMIVHQSADLVAKITNMSGMEDVRTVVYITNNHLTVSHVYFQSVRAERSIII